LSQKSVYFPNLDGLRFYAAISVVVVHVAASFAELRTIETRIPLLDMFLLDSQTAVTLFFVLSGFLITYLLLQERASLGTISIRRFYMRRILRIWPLYYLIVIVGLIIFPLLLGPDYELYNAPPNIFIFNFLFLANVVSATGPLFHLWSISLEEQFYLIWPWLARLEKHLLKIIIIILIVKFLLPFILLFYSSNSTINSINFTLALGFRLECMAFGGLGAYLYFYKPRLLFYLYTPFIQLGVLFLTLWIIIVDVPFSPIANYGISALFTILILNLATNPRSLISFDSPIINHLGKVSYGIYMYHFPLLYLLMFIAYRLQIANTPAYVAGLYVSTIGGTILLAIISYRWFETPFLKMKKRFDLDTSKGKSPLSNSRDVKPVEAQL
jgi:peptidoglycan/LPS O-acetylase OafA/YrhL